MTTRQALEFIRRHGVVLESARGLEPSLATEVAGAPIAGNWWAHPVAQEIYALTRSVHDSRSVLVCTLCNRRITCIHRRLWPAFVSLAKRFQPGALDRVREVHTVSGRHQRQDVPFPAWVPGPVLDQARAISVADAESRIQVWLSRYSITDRSD